MSGYTPKPGDRIRISAEGIVQEVSAHEVTVEGGIYDRAEYDFELIEAPFVVGQPITPEMGEPPEGSVIRSDAGSVYENVGSGWVSVGSLSPIGWDNFRPENNTLLYLGSVTS